jgi:hypothetical protein
MAMDKLWSTQELANFLGLPVQTIYQWRERKCGNTGRPGGRWAGTSAIADPKWSAGSTVLTGGLPDGRR